MQLRSSNKEKQNFEKFIILNEKYLLASYEVSYLIAKNKKPDTSGEKHLIPAALKMV